jgi:hypothetical protein
VEGWIFFLFWWLYLISKNSEHNGRFNTLYFLSYECLGTLNIVEKWSDAYRLFSTYIMNL